MLFYENSNSSKAVTTAVNECIEENILAEFQETTKRMLQALQLLQQKHSPEEVAHETGLPSETVLEILYKEGAVGK